MSLRSAWKPILTSRRFTSVAWVLLLRELVMPLLLQRIGVDPAVASSGFVTAVTDIAGFLLLLGLAAAVLLPAS